jgi:hypothetical protein
MPERTSRAGFEPATRRAAFLLLILAFSLSACLSTGTKSRLSDVTLGMTTYEVMAAAGPPDRTILHEVPNGRRVEWIYLSDGHQSVLLFENDVLIAISL